VFFLLHVGGVTLRERVRGTLELESGTNDPIAIFLTIAIIEFILAGGMEANPALIFIEDFALQLGLGSIFGLAGGWLMVRVLNRTELEAGLYPILLLASALALFALTTMLHGSGFLAVYIAGLFSGNAKMRGTVALRRFNSGMTWLAQIAMFLTLGLLATPAEFVEVALPATALGFMLIVFARPIAVWLCLWPFGFSRQEIAFIAWVGLRGAVSILLAILPMIGGVEGGRAMFNVAFIVVVISLLIQGWSINPMARRLRLIVPQRAGPVDRLELELPGRGDHEIVAYRVHPDSPVAKGERIPRWARPSLIIRDGRSLRPHTAGRPKPGDQIYIVTATDFVSLLDRLFAAPVAGFDPALYGEFVLDPDATLGDVGDVYGFKVADADRPLTLRNYLRRELAGDLEQGDRVSLGGVALIVRMVDENHAIEEIGLAVMPTPVSAPNIPVFQSPGEIADMAKRLFGRVRGRASESAVAEGPSVPVRSPEVEEVPTAPPSVPEEVATSKPPSSEPSTPAGQPEKAET
jgi:cell volume regulation protein A